MALQLKDILQTMKRTYGFVAKIACEGDFEETFGNRINVLKTILEAKGMTKMSTPKALPLSAQPFVFKRLQGFLGKYYSFEMEFEYPITPTELTNEIVSAFMINRAYVVVRTAENPFNKMESDYLKYDENDYLPQLVTDVMPSDIKEEDLVGDAYNEQLVKELQSKEAKKYQHTWTEVDKKDYKGQ